MANFIKMSGSVLSGSEAGSGYALGVSEFQMLDALTAGTVTASKLVVVDSNKDIKEFRNLRAVQLSASTNIVIGAADISEADLEQIDGLTAGTVAASKAVVVDANKDASGFRNVTATGAFIIGSANMDETDLEKLDGITNGAGAANKALVLDANADVASGLRRLAAAQSLVAGTTISGAAGISGASLDCDGDLTAGTITMTGYSVDADGDLSAKSLVSTSTVSGAAGVSGASLAADGNAVLGGSVTAGSSFIIGSADLNEVDMEKLDGITNGTVAASKAVVVDADKDASGFRNVTATGAITAGTSFIIGSADLNETDLEKLDGITDGTAAASKALVLDANKDASGMRDLSMRNVSASADVQLAGASNITGPGLSLSVADLEQLDDLTAGTVTASKAVVVDSNKDIASFRHLTAAGAITAGTSFIIGSADLNEADLEKLDGITDGTGAANKALVLSAASKINSGLSELTASSALISSGVIQSAGAAGFAGGYGSTGVSINADGDLFVNGNSTLDGTLTVAGAYGSTGVSISAAGNLDMDGNLAVGEDDDGSDVKFFGDTAGRYFQWDASADAVGIGKNPGSGYAIDVATGHGDVRADAFVTYSDRTLKTNIQTMDTALEKVMKLEAVTYDKVATGKSEIGFIAQDVAKVVPEICALDENGEGRGIDYSRMSALLAGALKAQQEQIAQLKEIVAKLQK